MTQHTCLTLWSKNGTSATLPKQLFVCFFHRNLILILQKFFSRYSKACRKAYYRKRCQGSKKTKLSAQNLFPRPRLSIIKLKLDFLRFWMIQPMLETGFFPATSPFSYRKQNFSFKMYFEHWIVSNHRKKSCMKTTNL